MKMMPFRPHNLNRLKTTYFPRGDLRAKLSLEGVHVIHLGCRQDKLREPA